MKHIITLTFPS